MLTTPLRQYSNYGGCEIFHRTMKLIVVMASTNSNLGKKRKIRNNAVQCLFQTHPSTMMITTMERMPLIWTVAMPMLKVRHCFHILFWFIFHHFMLCGRFPSTCHRTRLFKIRCLLQNTIRGAVLWISFLPMPPISVGSIQRLQQLIPQHAFAFNVKLPYSLFTTTHCCYTSVVINFHMPHKFFFLSELLILPFNVLCKVSATQQFLIS